VEEEGEPLMVAIVPAEVTISLLAVPLMKTALLVAASELIPPPPSRLVVLEL
jgi:hypothetical protein